MAGEEWAHLENKLDEVLDLVRQLSHRDDLAERDAQVLRRDFDRHTESLTAHDGVRKTAENAWRAVVGIASVIITSVVLAILAIVFNSGGG